MENSFFHKRAGGLVLAALPPGVHVPSRKSENSALCRDGLVASGEEGKVLPLFILQSLSSCLWCSCPFQFFVRRPFFFQRKKRFHGRSVFCSSAGILRCVLFRLSSRVGLSTGTPRGAQVSRRLGKRTAAEKWRRDTNIFSGGEKGSFTSQTYGFFIFPCPARLVMVPSDSGAIFWAKKCLKPQFHNGNFKIRIGSVRFSGRSSQ